MPTVLSIDGFRFYFYSDEGNEPAHIHIKKANGRGKWWLEPNLEEEYAYEFTLQERRQIKRLINQHYEYLKTQWYEYFQR
ncbi:hypothetical protein OKW21_005800 [Catalinimonas alkaloidigena]|uniref:DUF4160 domain-containing protein n=1 Tax=Catalinimonas alkaloidigena TaxID=1075417 RepID=UPI0024072429|nr:DUF4160 domain-containing protein [Catalinimonas alkaloidigena]MDF9800537.1 hypothetical protein [Catalinimonas alkaloidigena]